jgi:glucan biosynthesis protein C
MPTEDIPLTAGNAVDRFHYFDAMRGVLMALGVVFHSALVFSSEKRWLVYSGISAYRARDFAAGLHLFRMPAFFVISGYFTVLTLQRYGAWRFFRIRMTRIAVPLLVTALTVNSLQAFLLATTGWHSFSLMDYLQRGEWVSHLWFLVNLLIYFTIASVVASWCPDLIERAGRLAQAAFLSVPTAFWLFILSLSAVAVKTAGHFGVPIDALVWGFVDAESLLLYLPFFVFGAFLASDRALPLRLSSINLFATIGITIVAIWGWKAFGVSEGLFNGVARTWCESLAIWGSTLACFAAFARFANKKSQFFLWLSDASYSIYLFHQVLVVAFGLLLIQSGVGGWVGLILLVTVVASCSALIHQYVIRPVPLLRFLFNGKTSAGFFRLYSRNGRHQRRVPRSSGCTCSVTRG